MRSRSTHPKWGLLNIVWPFAWWLPHLLHLLTLERRDIPIAFWVTRSRSNYWSLSQHCPLNILWTICLIIAKLGTVIATGEWVIHHIYIYATPLHFAPGGQVCLSNISLLFTGTSIQYTGLVIDYSGLCTARNCFFQVSVMVHGPLLSGYWFQIIKLYGYITSKIFLASLYDICSVCLNTYLNLVLKDIWQMTVLFQCLLHDKEIRSGWCIISVSNMGHSRTGKGECVIRRNLNESRKFNELATCSR